MDSSVCVRGELELLRRSEEKVENLSSTLIHLFAPGQTKVAEQPDLPILTGTKQTRNVIISLLSQNRTRWVIFPRRGLY